MKNIFLRRPILAIVIAVVIVALGAISLRGLPIEQYPNITPPVVEVSAFYQGADAITVADAVATPVAQSVMGVDNMLYMQSTSSADGSMSLAVTFDIGSDPDMNTVFTQNRVQSAVAMLPTTVRQQGVTTQKTMNSFLMVVAIFSDGRYDGNFLSNWAMLNIRNELLKINGVGKVSVMGAGEYSMRVWIEPDKLDYLGISPSQIAAALEAQSGIFPVGKLGAEPAPSGTEFTYTVVLPPAISTPEEYGNIVVRTLDNGSEVLLKDVARVEFGSQSYGVSSLYNNRPATMLAIYQAPGSNALDVGTAVKKTMSGIASTMPDGMSYENIVDTTTVIKKGAIEIVYTLLLALVLVVLVIYMFIQDLRAMIIPLVAIPVSLLGAFMLFPLLGFTINIFSLLGLVLAIGLVVDDAIVVVEAVQVGIEKGLPPKQATAEAMKVVAPPIIATTLVLAAVFIPVSFMGGITGLLYQQFAITIAFSVLISAFNALTLSPALCSIWLRPRKPRTEGFFGRFNKWFGLRIDKYLSFTSSLTRHALRSLVLIGLIGAVVVVLFKVLPSGFLPEEDQGYVITALTLPAAASLERTEEAVAEAAAVIAHQPYTQSVTSVAGFSLLTGVAASNTAMIFTTLKDFSDRSMSASQIADQLMGELYVRVNSATSFTFGPPAIPGIGTSSGFSLMIQDKGGNTPAYLAENLGRFLEAANHRPEIAQAYTEFNTSTPQRKVNIDRAAAMAEGVSMDDIHSTLTTFLGGTYINNFNRFGQLYQTYIQADASYRQKASDLDSYFVTSDAGVSVPLSAFVTISDTTGVEYMTGFNLYNSATVMGSAAKGVSSAEAMNALEQVAAKTLPPDMGYAWSGMSYQERKASSGTLYAYLSALLFVFLVLSALYESWTLPFSILLGVPFALFGALLFIFLAHLVSTNYINDIFLQVSMIMLIGLSAKNAILIIEYADDLFTKGATLTDAAIGAARLRVRPILMTALAFLLGIMPLVFATGSNSIARNVMGLSLVGGMAVATVLGLVVYPLLFIVVGKISRLEKRRKKMEEQI